MHKTNDNIFSHASLLPPSTAAIRLVLFSCRLTQAEKCCTIKAQKKGEPQRWLAAIGFWWKLIRPYTSADDTDGHNIYEEVIQARMAFFVQ